MKRLVVIGGGESGVGAAVLGKVKGMDVWLTDMGTIAPRYKEILNKWEINWEEGHHTEEKVLAAHEIVKSPGVPLTAPLIVKAMAKGIPVISEIELAGRYTDAKMVCITGSNGKTTTKEMVKAVLSAKYNTHATQGNFNNHIGVPMTLFQLRHSHEAAVVEMGTSGPDEIRPLSLAVEPDVAVITNIGASHLERLGDLDGVFREKITIREGLKAGGTLIVNADDPRLCKVRKTRNMNVVTFGVKRGVIKPEKLTWNENACADFYIGRTHFVLNVPGTHNLYNALAAIAVGDAFRVPRTTIARALGNFRATNMRMEIRKAAGFKIVSDCYNANPSSTRMALQTIGHMDIRGSRIAVLGDMLELGKASKDLHKEIGALVPEMNFDLLLAVGKDAQEFVKGARAAGMAQAYHFDSVQEVIEFLGDVVSEGDVVLVKGSRGMHMEQVVDALTKLSPVSKD